jgi:uncharacterized membrane protein
MKSSHHDSRGATTVIATEGARAASLPTNRLTSLDILRGAVMVLMAIDHVRVYSGVPAGGPSAGIFFTRWVTHFCAPAFVFLAGTAAFLHGRKLLDVGALSRYLVTRGAILVLLELTVIRLSWTFNPAAMNWLLAGVIWMLGWCMVLMAGLVRLPTWAIGPFGLLVIAGQSIFGPLAGALPPSLGWLGKFLYLGEDVNVGANGPTIAVLYTIVPWIGVMAAGYAFGAILIREPQQRRRLCLRIGLSATALFLILGSVSVFLQTPQEDAPPALFRLLNQQKYPASQLFLLMTLGPTIALVPLAERARGWFSGMLATFGRVPMFYYLLHIPVIHLTALAVWLIRDGSVDTTRFDTAPYVSVPPDERWSLPLLYLVFVIVIAILYPLCRWFGGVKARRPGGWLRYI